MITAKGGSGYAKVGELEIYYDVEGAGPPVLLFHGGMGTADMFAELRGDLNAQWTTIGIEQQAHGHTGDVDRPLRYEQMADGKTVVIRDLGLEQCHAFGYSDGGNVALGRAIRHPELIDRVAICGTNADNDGLDPQMLAHLVAGARRSLRRSRPACRQCCARPMRRSPRILKLGPFSFTRCSNRPRTSRIEPRNKLKRSLRPCWSSSATTMLSRSSTRPGFRGSCLKASCVCFLAPTTSRRSRAQNGSRRSCKIS